MSSMAHFISSTGGKGGTGKTLFAVNLSIVLQREGYKVLLLDCDTDCPNASILFGIDLESGPRQPDMREEVRQYLPEINPDLCSRCGDCAKVCRPHSIFHIPDIVPVVLPQMCSGCGVCERICPVHAISPNSRKLVGQIFIFNNVSESGTTSKGRLDLWVGRLEVGEVRSAFIIEEMLKKYHNSSASMIYDFVILDTSPGTHCDVEKCLKNSDAVVCITEPTPFGHRDLNRILELAAFLKKPTKIVINRFGIANFLDPIYNLASEKSQGIMGKIPLDKQILESYAMGVPFVIRYPQSQITENFTQITHNLVSWIREVAHSDRM